jgi:predicted Zn finger-like uncharacterized protein
MLITCKKCSTAFNLDNSFIKEEGSKVRCSKCKNVFKVYQEKFEEIDLEDLERAITKAVSEIGVEEDISEDLIFPIDIEFENEEEEIDSWARIEDDEYEYVSVVDEEDEVEKEQSVIDEEYTEVIEEKIKKNPETIGEMHLDFYNEEDELIGSTEKKVGYNFVKEKKVNNRIGLIVFLLSALIFALGSFLYTFEGLDVIKKFLDMF